MNWTVLESKTMHSEADRDLRPVRSWDRPVRAILICDGNFVKDVV